MKGNMLICVDREAWKILVNMDEFRKDNLFCDVVVRCEDGASFHCHRLVLAAASPYFKAMFCGDMLEKSQNEILIKCVDSKALESLVKYAYNGVVETNFENIIDLLSAANMLRFEAVEKHCIDFLYKNMNMANCIAICTIAETLNYEELFRYAEIYVIKNFRWLVRHSKFIDMTASQLSSALGSDQLSIASESEVYQAVIDWVRFEYEVRCKHLFNLLKDIRFTSMSRKFFVDVVMRESMIMDSHECRMLVLAALNHYLVPERRASLQKAFPLPRRSSGNTLFVAGGIGIYQASVFTMRNNFAFL